MELNVPVFLKGKIKSINILRGFGFIEPYNGEEAVFFDASALKDITFKELLEGDHVEYQQVSTPYGPKAICVKKDVKNITPEL